MIRLPGRDVTAWQRFAVGVLAGALVVAGSGTGSAAIGGATARIIGFQPTFQEVPCPPVLSAEEGSVLSCGYLTVLENRQVPDGRTIRLFVTKAEPLEGHPPPDPVFVVGRDLVGARPSGLGRVLGIRAGRTAISMDARGVGFSEPNLACPEVQQLTEPSSPTTLATAEMEAPLLDAVRACHDRLTASGVDLASYNLEAMAADAEDLRIALGIDEWNLISYGTASSISFEIMRRYPEHVRSAWFDSPMPPQVDRFTQAVVGTEWAFGQIARACGAQPSCHAAFPHLHRAWNGALRRLHEHPSSIHDEDLDILVDDATAVRYLRNNLAEGMHETRDVPEFPWAVYDLLKRGWVNGGPAGDEVGWASAPPLYAGYEVQWGDAYDLHFGYDPSRGRPPEGTFYSYVCHDEVPFVDEAALKKRAGGKPWYVEAYVDNPYRAICARWNVGKAGTDPHVPVRSDVPVLMMSGQFDPYSPLPLIKQTARTLSSSWVVEVPWWSRNVVALDCPISIRDAWMAHPTSPPDTKCLADVSPVDFVLPPPQTKVPGPDDAVITTVAGDGAYGSSGDGDLATRAQLATSTDVSVDPAGNLYVIEEDGARVRRVDSLSGWISTAVGPPTGIAHPPQGDAGTVELRGATALATDARGNLYVGGGLGSRNVIIRVSPSGDATVIAGTGEPGFSGDGGPATQAMLSWVRDIVVDDQGNVYFTDYLNRIRLVDPAGIITTIAGTGEKGFSGDGGAAIKAKLSHPSGISMDAHGNIYFADHGNNRVRRIDQLGKITTVAGNGNGGYEGDGGPAKEAALGTPLGVLAGANGNLYVSSADCSCVRIVDANGIISTIVGTGHPGFSGDGGPASRARLELACCNPVGMAFGPDGALYIANSGYLGYSRVRKVVFP